MKKKIEDLERSRKIVFVGLSGGVDSAVSAALLKQQGFEVVGVFIKTWHPEFLACNEEDERRDAMRVAAHLDIPFLTFDLEDVYKKEVGDYMIREYKAGRTPNPDVMCNKEVKFGAFLKKALAMGADFVATGHYSRLEPEFFISNSKFLNKENKIFKNSKLRNSLKIKNLKLKISVDYTKDQSYFLWTLKQQQLAKIIFPIGHLKKSQVRKRARDFGLPVADKKDSQGICFLGQVDLKKFLKHYIKEKRGKVVLAPQDAGDKEGQIVGHHGGALFFTLGERHGFTITKKGPTDGPYYVVGKDLKKNTLIVSQNKNLKNFPVFALGDKKTGNPRLLNFSNFCIDLSNTNWISGAPKENKKYQSQIRYHGQLLPCHIKVLKGNKAQISFNEDILVAPGQSCVVYDGEICMGGGIVE